MTDDLDEMERAVGRAGRASAQLLTAAGLAVVSYFFLALLVFTACTALLVIGAGMVPETALLLHRLTGYKRRKVAAWTGEPLPEAYAQLTGTLPERVRTAVKDPGTRQDLRWYALHCVYGMLLPCLALPVWFTGLVVDGVWCGALRRRAVVLPLIERLADLDAAWSRALLMPSPEARRTAELAERVEELTVTRAGAVAAHGAELRRIERDLHDGAQARLVALSMRVGLAKRAYENNPDMTRKLLDDAQDQAEEALTELRHVVRGIHPPILTDRGLVGAVRALAAGSGLDVRVDVVGLDGEPAPADGTGPAEGTGPAGNPGSPGDPGSPGGTASAAVPVGAPRAPAAVEAAAYFVVAEALTNAAKHSGADRASVRLERTADRLRLTVRDEGRGGADDSGRGGSGLLGMRRRVAALDGTVDMTSPVGGPTVIEVELPCVW